MFKKYISSLLLVVLFSGNIQSGNLDSSLMQDRIFGCIYGGLIGDALGAPTEFISSFDQIMKRYPGGIRHFNDLQKYNLCWKNKETGQLYAHYTDDTAMARLTLEVLVKSKQNDRSFQQTMEGLALSYVMDMYNNPTGWAMPARAPGNCCTKRVRELHEGLSKAMHGGKLDPAWWRAGGPDDGGCGSVMRAHPFGIIFAEDPEKAASWAAEHSKITHGATIAQAACAAMAAGIASALQGSDIDCILKNMIDAAGIYDENTADKIEHACSLAQKHGVNSKLGTKKRQQDLFDAAKEDQVFDIYEGWAADDAIAAAAYILAISPDNAHDAIVLGVHTPGDSDSIASMAGALVGARMGAKHIHQYHNTDVYEGSKTLEQYGLNAAKLLAEALFPASV